VHNAVDLPDATHETSEQVSGFCRPFIMSAGRLVVNKGFDTLLKAFARIANDFCGIDLLIVGDGPERDQLTSLANELGLSGRVMFVGRMDRQQISNLYERCHFFVCASPIESFGIACLEAMSSGKALIAPKTGGPPEFINDDEGILVDTNKVEDVAEAMRDLLANTTRLKRMGIASKLKSLRFTWSSIIEQYLDVYSAVGRCR
jgi:glycosyltransferase involved in cell wall biosynthesis